MTEIQPICATSYVRLLCCFTHLVCANWLIKNAVCILLSGPSTTRTYCTLTQTCHMSTHHVFCFCFVSTSVPTLQKCV